MSVLSRPYFHCDEAAFAHLESVVWANGVACPHCGSDEETGWSDNAEGLAEAGGVGDDDFDYSEFVEREFPDEGAGHATGRGKWLKAGCLLVLIAMAIALWLGR